LPAALRLLIQVAVVTAVLAVVLRGDALELAAGLRVPLPSRLALAPGVLLVVGIVNIYNFMDGMDGLAATQTVGAGVALGTCAIAAGQLDVALVALCLASAGAGFFVHNAPPATLFLGDAGSTFLGFSFGCLAVVAATRPSPVPIGVVPAALAPFLLDGTFTILRRLRRGERIWLPHRSHLYQRAVATGLGHRDVLVVYAGWCAAAAAAAIFVGQCGPSRSLETAIGLVALLGLVWAWVVRLEAAVPRSSD
jgi:UDP-N-acetylmuramyl pentapeptide phosphotransferase/UDP-N-acetylglucosamine-1-phosphate transferase